MSYNEWIDIDVLEDYLDGKLDSKTMHLVEKISLEDSFVAEALAGLSQSPKRTLHLSLLQKQLQERISQKPVAQKRWRITSHRLSIGAAAAVLFVTVSILFWMKENNNREQLSQKQAKKIEVNIAPQIAKKNEVVKQDSIASSTVVPPVVAATKNNNIKASQHLEKSKAETSIDNPPVVIAEPVAAAAMITKLDTAKVAARPEVGHIAVAMLGRKKDAVKPSAPLTVALPSKAEGIRVETNFNAVPYNGIINGRVYTKENGSPLSGAVVKVNGTNKATTTNIKGEFSLSADTSSLQNLSIAYLGYATQQVNAKTNQTVNVVLEANSNSLNEVVIAESADRSKKTNAASQTLNNIGSMSSNASPIGGWTRFDEYLKANNKLYKESAVPKFVTLSFSIKKDGRASNVKVVTGLTKTENQEAIRLIEEGPNWIPQSADRSAKLSIKF